MDLVVESVGTISSETKSTIETISSSSTATIPDVRITSPSMQLAAPFGYRRQMLGSTTPFPHHTGCVVVSVAEVDHEIVYNRLPSLHSHTDAIANENERHAEQHHRAFNTNHTTNMNATNLSPFDGTSDNMETQQISSGPEEAERHQQPHSRHYSHTKQNHHPGGYYHQFAENGQNNFSNLAIEDNTSYTHIEGEANASLTSHYEAISPMLKTSCLEGASVPHSGFWLGCNVNSLPLPLLPQPPSDDSTARQRVEGYSRQWFAAHLTPETAMDTTHSSLSSQNIKKQIFPNIVLGDLNQQRSSRRQANTRVVLLDDHTLMEQRTVNNDTTRKRNKKNCLFVDGTGSDLCNSMSPPPALVSASPILTRCSSVSSSTRRSQHHHAKEGGYRSPSYFRAGSMNSNLTNAEKDYTVMMLDFSAPALVHSASSNGGITRVESNLYSKIDRYESYGRLSPSLSSASGWVRDNQRHPNQPDGGSSVATDGVVPILGGTTVSQALHMHDLASDTDQQDFSLASEDFSAVLNYSP